MAVPTRKRTSCVRPDNIRASLPSVVVHKRRSRARGEVSREERELFAREFARVLRSLPAQVEKLLQNIPLAVDDYPTTDVLEEMAVESDELFGLYIGTPPVVRSVGQAGEPGDIIHIYRLALLRDAGSDAGVVNQERLREQIFKTLLHELGHYHGLDENDLDRLGY